MLSIDASVPPWIGYIEEEQLKAQILEISAVSCGCGSNHAFIN